MAIAGALIRRLLGASVGAELLRRGVAGRRGTVGMGPAAGIGVQAYVRAEGADIERLIDTHNWVQAAALSRTARSAATVTRRELAQVKNIPQKVLSKRVRAWRAYPKQKPIRAAVWVGTAKPIKAAELKGAVGLNRGGQVKVGRRIYKDAFPARMPGGHRGIFTRKPGATHQRRPDGQMTQLPIEEAIVQLMPEAEGISRRASERAMVQIYPKEVRRLMEIRTRRWRVR